ncbi:MAG: endolytic transglycosylase MltG [Bacillota bacterium]|nr:endolytic transglycosylase MltG [Bacillota bacterium]
MKKVVIPVIILVLALMIAIPAYLYFAPVNVESTVIEVPEDSNSGRIGEILKDNDLIRSETAFKVYLRISGEGSQLKPGEYSFAGKYAMSDITAELIEGGALTETEAKVTIPEGYNLEQIAAVLEEAGVCTVDEFNDAVANGDYIYDYLPAKGNENRLEGFLYPETYFFSKSDGAENIIAAMLAQFDSVFSDEWRAQLEADGRSVYDWVTMASIVEKEAVVEEDRPIIAGVFYNRLEQGMLLQSCATVQYALGEVKPVLSNEDVQIDSPYNTYINQGLPPAPIACPGYDSLEAAMYPADTDYLFFVAKPNGAHIFTETYDEHLAAKAAIENGDYDNE